MITWQKSHGRHNLPWQQSRDAYRVWLSEIMLQQTQVAAVIPYYLRFLASFPDVRCLANASSEQVMAHWSGLGYYTRARNLHACAKRVVAEFGGQFPADPAVLAELPGIGRSTAAAIAAFAYGARAAILDGNVKRVFARVFGIEGFPGTRQIELAMWQRAEALLPADVPGIESYTQGLMDLGATVCSRSRPRCGVCPLSARCVALATDRVADLPAKKGKKAVPQRQVRMMLVLDDQGQVLLEKRPELGIWGGLYSLPELAYRTDQSERDIAQGIGEALASLGDLESLRALPPFAHGFTHFKLDIHPTLCRLHRRATAVAQDSLVWIPLAQYDEAPLPSPIKKMLGWANAGGAATEQETKYEAKYETEPLKPSKETA